MQYTWQLALVLVPVYFIKHSVSCYIYYIHVQCLPQNLETTLMTSSTIKFVVYTNHLSQVNYEYGFRPCNL